jgi:hypothetical protein
MRRPGWIWLLVGVLVAGLLVLPAAPSYAWRHHGGGVFIGVGPPWWGPPYPYYWYPPPPYYYPPAPIVVEQPSVYVQQETAPPAWYYCPSAQGYYPQVQSCPEAWVKVAPRAP